MPSPDAQICPFHTDEFIRATYVGGETLDYEYTCPRKDHPSPGCIGGQSYPNLSPCRRQHRSRLGHRTAKAVAAAVATHGSTRLVAGTTTTPSPSTRYLPARIGPTAPCGMRPANR